MSKYAFGIDLGTTNSALAMNAGGVSETVPIFGHNTIPSVVWYRADGSVIVGREAYKRKHQKDVVYSSKRDMGSNTVYHLELEDGSTKDVTPVDVASEVLKAIVKGADPMYGEVDEVVITVPAYFNDSQRIATRQAAEKAGLKVLGMINEPTAAALAYGINQQKNTASNVLVVDVGGGTTDITLMNITNYDSEEDIPEPLRDFIKPGLTFDVIATGGNNRLGGDDYDEHILESGKVRLIRENNEKRKVIKQDKKNINKKLLEENTALTKYYRECLTPERFKPDIELWKKLESDGISIDDIKYSRNFSLKTEDKIDGFKKFWKPINDCIENTLNYKTLDENGEDKLIGRYSDPQVCIPVGGSTKNPWLLASIQKKFENTGMEIPNSTFADEAIALGAAVKSAMIKGINTNITLKEINPIPIGIETVGERNGKIIEGAFYPIIHKDVTIPIRQSIFYSTYLDGQTEITVNIYQGTSSIAKNNNYLGTLVIKDLPAKPAGEVITEIFLEVDINGMLTVTAMYNGEIQTANFNSILNAATREYTPAEERTMKFMLSVKDYMENVGDTEHEDYLAICNWVPGNSIPKYAIDNRQAVSDFVTQALNVTLTKHFSKYESDTEDDGDI